MPDQRTKRRAPEDDLAWSWYARKRHTRQVWSGWRTIFWWLRALHVMDLEWSGSVVRLVWLRRAREKGDG